MSYIRNKLCVVIWPFDTYIKSLTYKLISSLFMKPTRVIFLRNPFDPRRPRKYDFIVPTIKTIIYLNKGYLSTIVSFTQLTFFVTY